MQTNVIRRIDVRATTSGVDESRQKLTQFSEAQTGAASSAGELERAMQRTQRAMDLSNRMFQQAVDAQRAAIAANDNYAGSHSAVAAALRAGAKAAVDQAASWAATAVQAAAVTAALSALALILGPLYIAYRAVKFVVEELSEAWDLGGKKLEEYRQIAERAAKIDLSTSYFQRLTKGATDARANVDDLTKAIATLERQSRDQLGGSPLANRLAASVKAGNFAGNTGVGEIAQANTTEERYRAVVSLINQAMQAGQRLAALDIAGTAFGPEAAENLRKDSEYFDKINAAAAKVAEKALVSPEDIGRAIDLQQRYDAAVKILETRWHPIQDLLTQMGIEFRANWVGTVETIAQGVDWATKLVAKLGDVPPWFQQKLNQAGQFMTDTFTTPESRAAAEKSYGISSDPAEMARGTDAYSVAVNKLRAGLQDQAEQSRKVAEANTIAQKVLGDTSKEIKDQTKATQDQADAYDRAFEAVTKHTARMRADAQAVGLGAGALEEFRARSQLTIAAQVAGREPTAALTAEIEKQARAAGEASAALARMRVSDQIKFDRATAFLSPEDLQIAQQLRSIYGSDVPAALASSEASAMRFNLQLKSINDIGRNAVSSFANDLVSGLRNGESAMAALGQAASNLSQTLTSGALTSLLKGDFLAAGIQGIAAVVTGIFGNSQKKREKEAQEAKAAAERMEAYAQRAQLARIDTSNEAGALQAFEVKAQKQRLDEMRAGGRGMAALEQALAEERLAIVDRFAREAAAAEEAARKAALQRASSFRDRMFAASNDNSTLDGALAEFNRRALQEQVAEIEAGGQAINELIAAQEAERLGIYKKFNDQAIAQAKQTAEELVRYVQGVQQRITQYLQGLKVGANSTLSPQQQLQSASDNFAAQLARAQAGDRTAIDNITTVAQTLLDQARGFYGSSGGYTEIYDRVVAALQGVANINVNTVSDADKIAAAVQAGAASTVTAVQGATQAVNITGAQADALSAAQNALAAQQVVYLQTQYALLGSINSLADRFVAAINGLGVFTAGIGGQQILLLSAIAKSNGKSFWQWLGFENGGVIPGYADGGMIGNGLFNRDSVLARYAGGGAIALAGGEFVMPAYQTQRFLPQLEAMRSGSPANDNGWREIGSAINSQTQILATRFDAMAAEIAALRADNRSLQNKISLLLANTKAA